MPDRSQSLPIVIRQARIAERLLLEDLQRRASLASPSDQAQLLAHPDAIELPAEQIAAGLVYVAERQGRIVGFGVMLPQSEDEAELDGLFVEPDNWKQGIGRLLVAHLERVAIDAGATWLRVLANPDALSFYEACGFTRIGEQQMRFGAAIVMRKLLPAGRGGE